MGIEGAGDGFRIQNQPNLSSTNAPTPLSPTADKTNSLVSNILPMGAQAGAVGEIPKPVMNAEVPVLDGPVSNAPENMVGQVNQMIIDFQLPTGADLASKLSKQITDQLQNIINQFGDADSTNTDMKGFFDLLSKLYPLSVSMTSNMLNTEIPQDGIVMPQVDPSLQESSPSLLPILKEAGTQISQILNSATLSPDDKTQLQTLASQLLNLTDSTNPAELGKLLTLASSLSSSIPQNTNTLLTLLSNLQNLSPEQQHLALTSMLATQSETAKGLVGPNISAFTDEIGKFIKDITQKMEGVSTANDHLYSSAFKESILSGAILGHILASGETKNTEHAAHLAALKLNSIKELGIIDQIPFSFMAFFPDLRHTPQGNSDAVQMAKNALMQLIRLLLQLVFILTAIASAGNKLGQKEMDLILEKNSEYITRILDTLVFALKKIDESYGVSVSFHIASIEHAKDALALKNYPNFWFSIIHMFSAKTELSAFLEEIEDAKPLFKTLKSLLEPEKPLPINIQM